MKIDKWRVPMALLMIYMMVSMTALAVAICWAGVVWATRVFS